MDHRAYAVCVLILALTELVIAGGSPNVAPQAGTGIEEMEEEEVSVETVSDDMTHDSMPMDDRVAMNNGPTLGENLNTMEEPKREMPGDSGLTNSGSAPMPDFFVSSPNLLPPLQFATGNQVNPINLPGLQGTHTRNHKIFSIPTSKGFDFDDSFNVNGVFSASGRKNDGVTITGLGTGSATIIGTKNDHIQFVKPDILGSSTGDLNVQETFNIGGVGSGSINKARIADNSFRFNRQLGFANFGVGGFVKENINVNGLGFLGRVSGVFNQDKGGDFNLATPFGTLSGRSNTVNRLNIQRTPLQRTPLSVQPVVDSMHDVPLDLSQIKDDDLFILV